MDEILTRVCVGEARVDAGGDDGVPTLRVVIAHTNRADRQGTSFGKFTYRKRVPMAGYDHEGPPLWIGALSVQANAKDPKQQDLVWEGRLDGLDDPYRRRTADAIIGMGEDQEFSHRFKPMARARLTKDDTIHFPVVEVYETAPVYRAGTEETGTKYARSIDGIRKGLTAEAAPEAEAEAAPEAEAEAAPESEPEPAAAPDAESKAAAYRRMANILNLPDLD